MGQSVSVQEPSPPAAPPLHPATAKPLSSSSSFNSKSSSSFNFGQQDLRITDDEQVSKQKYWIEDSGANRFTLFARDLTITWGDDSRYWQWSLLKDTTSVDDEGLVEVAELLNVCWLEVHGKFETSNLTPETIYEVVFVVMIKDPAYGWETPVNLRLVLPDGQTQQHEENLSSKMKCQWIQLQAGEFYLTSTSKKGTMKFSLFEYHGGQWKKGILIKGVIIRPKK